MTVATDAVFEMPEDGDNEGERHSDADPQLEAHVDEENVPHPGKVNAHDDAENVVEK